MRIRYCPKCNRAGLKWRDPDGLDVNGMTEHEAYEAYRDGKPVPSKYGYRYCPRCKEWVNADVGDRIDQHKIR